jgi:hypothetical protein
LSSDELLRFNAAKRDLLHMTERVAEYKGELERSSLGRYAHLNRGGRDTNTAGRLSPAILAAWSLACSAIVP